MADFIADSPRQWAIPEDVAERAAARRRGIDAAREHDEAEAERVGTIWSDWLRRMRETGQASEEPDLRDYIGL
jgi:hypothetical protein